jgi:hypothetical protein
MKAINCILMVIMLLSPVPVSHAASVSGSILAPDDPVLGKKPRFDVRALHLALRRSTGGADPVKQTKEDVLKTIERGSTLGFNVIMLKVNLAIQLKNTKGFASPWAYSIEDIKEILRIARGAGMEIIPEVNLLTHQHLLMLQIDKGLMLNDADYNPNAPKVYDIVFPVLDEIIQIFEPKYIHIGHDEAYGIRKKVAMHPPARPLTPDEYLSDTIRIYDYLKKKNIRTMMWADMLLDPRIYGAQYHGSEVNGYDGFPAVLDKLPKDIILCDWHYISHGPDFPSYTDLQKKGFTVWGAVWQDPETINAYSAYVARFARKNEGMIATTWWPFVAQEKEVIERILDTTSRAFFR